ncbi:MAG: ABC transporter substrate-binding protein, partial [Pirellulales bacterium]|nr:ABC transporter substrate-binding protein [Pirellulales bacterium]
SMGDRYGPMVVAKEKQSLEELKTQTIAVPGTLTTAYLSLRMCLGVDFDHVVVPFDEILDAVVAGEFDGKKIDAGLIIHEGQLTYGEQDLALCVDLGEWWYSETDLPLPLGANAIRKDLGETVIKDVTRLLKESIQFGLDHREDALAYALQFGRDLDSAQADKFVGMYVNDWTLDFGERGRRAVAELLRRGHSSGVIPTLIEPEFVEMES